MQLLINYFKFLFSLKRNENNNLIHFVFINICALNLFEEEGMSLPKTVWPIFFADLHVSFSKCYGTISSIGGHMNGVIIEENTILRPKREVKNGSLWKRIDLRKHHLVLCVLCSELQENIFFYSFQKAAIFSYLYLSRTSEKRWAKSHFSYIINRFKLYQHYT